MVRVCNEPLYGFALREAQILYLIYRRHGRLGTYRTVSRYMYQKCLLLSCLFMGMVVSSTALQQRLVATFYSILSTAFRFASTGLFQHISNCKISRFISMTTPEQFILLAIGLFTILVRIFFRWRTVGISNWQLDDYLMPLTGVSSSISTKLAGRLVHRS